MLRWRSGISRISVAKKSRLRVISAAISAGDNISDQAAANKIASGIPSNQREILEARRTITDLALDMAGRGEIELNPDQEDGPVFT